MFKPRAIDGLLQHNGRRADARSPFLRGFNSARLAKPFHSSFLFISPTYFAQLQDIRESQVQFRRFHFISQGKRYHCQTDRADATCTARARTAPIGAACRAAQRFRRCIAAADVGETPTCARQAPLKADFDALSRYMRDARSIEDRLHGVDDMMPHAIKWCRASMRYFAPRRGSQ